MSVSRYSSDNSDNEVFFPARDDTSSGTSPTDINSIIGNLSNKVLSRSPTPPITTPERAIEFFSGAITVVQMTRSNILTYLERPADLVVNYSTLLDGLMNCGTAVSNGSAYRGVIGIVQIVAATFNITKAQEAKNNSGQAALIDGAQHTTQSLLGINLYLEQSAEKLRTGLDTAQSEVEKATKEIEKIRIRLNKGSSEIRDLLCYTKNLLEDNSKIKEQIVSKYNSLITTKNDMLTKIDDASKFVETIKRENLSSPLSSEDCKKKFESINMQLESLVEHFNKLSIVVNDELKVMQEIMSLEEKSNQISEKVVQTQTLIKQIGEKFTNQTHDELENLQIDCLDSLTKTLEQGAEDLSDVERFLVLQRYGFMLLIEQLNKLKPQSDSILSTSKAIGLGIASTVVCGPAIAGALTVSADAMLNHKQDVVTNLQKIFVPLPKGTQLFQGKFIEANYNPESTGIQGTLQREHSHSQGIISLYQAPYQPRPLSTEEGFEIVSEPFYSVKFNLNLLDNGHRYAVLIDDLIKLNQTLCDSVDSKALSSESARMILSELFQAPIFASTTYKHRLLDPLAQVFFQSLINKISDTKINESLWLAPSEKALIQELCPAYTNNCNLVKGPEFSYHVEFLETTSKVKPVVGSFLDLLKTVVPTMISSTLDSWIKEYTGLGDLTSHTIGLLKIETHGIQYVSLFNCNNQNAIKSHISNTITEMRKNKVPPETIASIGRSLAIHPIERGGGHEKCHLLPHEVQHLFYES